MDERDSGSRPEAEPVGDDDEGSYTARPSKEKPQEAGRTRREEDERVERTGDRGGAEPAEEGPPADSGG